MHAAGPRTIPSESDWTQALEEIRLAPWRLQLAYQPILDLDRGALWGYEALARFMARPAQGPDAWFAAATRHQVAGELEAGAVRLALAARHRMPAGSRLAVNVSPTELVSPEVLEAFAEAESLASIVVEITENAPVEDYGRLREAVDRLRAKGAALAIDDVGSGHSGLRHIIELEPQYVKIDRPLIAQLEPGTPGAAVVEAVSDICRGIGARAIAEGVEHPDELRSLSSLGVSLVQGFLVGHPRLMPRASRHWRSIVGRRDR